MLYKIIILSLVYIGISFAVDPAELGKQLGKDFLENYGKGDKFKKKIINPINSSEPLKTPSGKDVYFQIGCPDKDKAILIKFLPKGSNEYEIVINQDMNFDGTFDYTLRTSSVLKANVSGVCENGLVSCDPGSWNNCFYYRWEADFSGKISLIHSIDGSGVGRCECTNASCGMDLIGMNKHYQIAGIITNLIMSKNNRFMFSDSKFDSATNTISISGQDLDSCSKLSTSDIKEKTPTKYYSDKPDFPDVSVEVAYQKSKPDSPYNLLSSVPFGSHPSMVTCQISNTYSATITDKTETCSETISYGGSVWCVIGKDTNCSSFLGSTCTGHISDTSPTKRSGSFSGTIKPYQEVAVLFAMNWFNGDKSRYYKGNVSTSGDIIEAVNWNISPAIKSAGIYFKSIDRSSKIEDTLSINVSFYHEGRGKGLNHTYSPKYYWAYLLKGTTYKQINESFVHSDTCSSHSSCKLFKEEICDLDGNCVTTVVNYTRKSITLMPVCHTQITPIGTQFLCADGSVVKVKRGSFEKVLYSGTDAWFTIKRIYDCGSSTTATYDTTKFMNAYNSANYSSGNISYKDKTGATKNITVEEPIKSSCPVQYCFTTRTSGDTTAYYDSTNKSMFPSGASTEEMAVKTCVLEPDGSFSCPLEAGETIVSDCSCDISKDNAGFTKAMTAIGILEEASKDIICSSSPP